MKICKNCQKKYNDDVKFCPSCGSVLAPINEKVFCPSCGQKNNPSAQFCNSCGTSLATGRSVGQAGQGQAVMTNAAVHNGNSSGSNRGNTVLIGIIVALAVILLGVVLVIVFQQGSKDKDVAVSKNQTENNTVTATTEAVDFGIYTDYYKDLDDIFGKLIIADSTSGQVTSYKSGLKDAIDAKNADNCNYDKLKNLEAAALKSSKEKIQSLEASLGKLEKKSYAKSAKKDTEYKKNKGLAKDELSAQNYKKAKTYYEACIEMLKKAKKSNSSNSSGSGTSSSNSSRTDDSWYKYTGEDTETYSAVYYERLSPAVVDSLSAEGKRYYMNTLFAAYGYRFNNSTIQNYYNSQSWYSADYSIEPGDQTAIRKKFDSTCEYNYNLLKR